MDERPELHNGHWRIAVWALRVGYLALIVGCVGLIATLFGSAPWVLAVGLITWLAATAVTWTNFVWARHELPGPRVGAWSMQQMLVRDTVHRRSSAQAP